MARKRAARVRLTKPQAEALRQAAMEIKTGEMDEDHGWDSRTIAVLDRAIAVLEAIIG